MRAANTGQMREIERMTINEYGISGTVLMENAGRAVAECAASYNAERYTVVCGKGNNGGDGCVAARHLYNMGKQVTIMMIGRPEELSGDARLNYEIAKKIGIDIEEGLKEDTLKNSDVIIDALIGIGIKGAPRGEIKEAIISINRSGKKVVAIDVPSGVNTDTGAVEGECVRADDTVTFGVHRLGLACCPGAQYAGRVHVRDISFARQAIDRQGIDVFITEKADIPKRRPDSHKGTYGRVFALCGSTGYTGAAYLSALAALKTGCGLVTLGVPAGIYGILAQKLTEVITLPLNDHNGKLSADCLPCVDGAVMGADAVICGCGLGRSADIERVVGHIIQNSRAPVVLDADGINAIASRKDILKAKKCDVIITPHMGEMSRLTGIDVCDIQNNAPVVAKAFALEYNVITVLKGSNSIVAFPNGRLHINTNGNSGMATAGSGDVLAGIIASLAAQGLTPEQAAVNGVFLHAEAGDLAAERLGQHGMVAGDILNSIPYVLKEVI